MGRIIAIALVSGAIWWLWRRWQNPTSQIKSDGKQASQKLLQCQRCDAMLPSNSADRRAIASGCEHGERCPLHQEH
jgi:uncharacterized paraquat-inducible protein A